MKKYYLQAALFIILWTFGTLALVMVVVTLLSKT